MNTRLFCRRATFILLVMLGCLILTAAVLRPVMRSAQPRLEEFKDGFTQRGGQAWFNGEQFADDVRSRIASSFSKLRRTLFPAAVGQPPPVPTATDSVQLSDQAPQPPPTDS